MEESLDFVLSVVGSLPEAIKRRSVKVWVKL